MSNRWKRHRARLEALKVKSPEWVCPQLEAKGWLLMNHYAIHQGPALPFDQLYGNSAKTAEQTLCATVPLMHAPAAPSTPPEFAVPSGAPTLLQAQPSVP
eukprot:121957-Amphidinium_carterae.1